MLNRADNPYRSEFATIRSSADRSFDERPGLRIAVLFAVIALALGTIAVRLMFVQTHCRDEYAAEFDLYHRAARNDSEPRRTHHRRRRRGACRRPVYARAESPLSLAGTSARSRVALDAGAVAA